MMALLELCNLLISNCEDKMQRAADLSERAGWRAQLYFYAGLRDKIQQEIDRSLKA